MKNNIILLISFIMSCTLFSSCDEDTHGPEYKDGTLPGQLTVREMIPTPGGAVIKYDLPKELDILYVEAKFTLENGRKMQVRSSSYVDSLSLEGFGKAGEYPVELFTVDRSENRSEALTTSIETLTAPVDNIFTTVEISKTFGGFKLKWRNESKAPIALLLMALPDSAKDNQSLEIFETVYTQASEGEMSFRGFGPVSHEFAVQVRDRWDNLSEIHKETIVPLLEEELDKSKFRELKLPGDVLTERPWIPGASTMTALWDGDLWNRMVATHGDMPDDYYYTFDLGVNVQLSRLKFWQFFWGSDGSEYFYFDVQYQNFEVWGAKTLDTSGSFDNWTLLRKCEVVKPSGTPLAKGNFTNEDKEAAFAGHDFEFQLDIPEVRYIRIKVNNTFANINWSSCGEMSFFGQINE
ncbi:MAG: DUF5000 domain-containing lipoprotein [Carboxylicivirga sp.]|jgi:hypothetical protein|nr:DUF5000 domain-containing lipoprotein [Carboxylicivirga sp.]